MGRIHSSGRIPAAGLVQDLEWVVVGNGIMDLSENEMEIWFSAQDRDRRVGEAAGTDWTEPVEPREFIQNRMLPDGTMLSVYNEVYPSRQRPELHQHLSEPVLLRQRR